jgi:hypothetical protein
MLGLDYAGGRPVPASIVAGGYSFVARYLSPGGASLPGKQLLPDEYRALLAAGIAVVLNWETTATRMQGGRAAGIADAQAAQSAVGALGVPGDRPIYFSADWDATPADQTLIDAYLAGAASVIGADRVGVYGSYYVVQRCLDHQSARWAWQTMAWSGGQCEARAHLRQRIGTVIVGAVECDVNEALQFDFGQHPMSKPQGKNKADMIQIPSTAMPTMPNSDPKTWPQRNFIVPWNVAGGWEGSAAFSFGVQDWPNRTVDQVRGYLYLASWVLGGGKLVPINAGLGPNGGGLLLNAQTLTMEYLAPQGAVGVTLNYAAPNGAFGALGRSG